MAVKTFITGEKLTAADTNTYLNNGGLVYITEIAITAAASRSIDNCFTSTYDNYRIIISAAKGTVATGIGFKLRASGTATSTGYYFGGLNVTYSTGAIGNSTGNNAASWDTTIILDTTNTTAGTIDVFGPRLAFTTGMSLQGVDPRTGGASRWNGGFQNSTTQFDGFEIFPNTGSFAAQGKILVYGYRQA